jgi:hypothetical protein
LPHLGDIAVDYQEKGIQIIALNYQESVGIVQGYQNTYPEILFLLDDSSIYSLYAQNNYIPLNYVLNHDFDQTVEYWEEGFDEDAVLGTVNDVRSDLVATLYPEADSYAPGETIGYNLKLKSWTLMPVGAYVVLDAVFPSGNTQRLKMAYLNFTLSEEKMFGLQQVIPMDVPSGDFKIRVQVGMPPGDLWSADYFDFTITP